MATPAQSLQAVPNQVKLRFNKSLQAILGERLLRRKITLPKYIVELIENDVAPLRLDIWREKVSPAREGEKIERKDCRRDCRRKLRAQLLP